MKRVSRASSLLRFSREWRASGATIGFVPTMGFLHEGHLSLVRRARRETDVVIASLFVNPLQFGPSEDYAAYPRDERRDRRLLREAGVDAVFEPAPDEVYDADFSTYVEVIGLDARLCGPRRPGHFRGVTTVVTKLLHAAEPDRLYLGQKDYQQAAILRRMVRDLGFAVRVVVCPTVREPDGLAMSSRNIYLSDAERAWAPRLHAALRETAGEIERGEIRTREDAESRLAWRLDEGPGDLEYAEVLSADSLAPISPLRGELVLALAYRLGRARLIDNTLARVKRGRKRTETKAKNPKAKSRAKKKAKVR